MITTPSRIIWEMAGSPVADACIDAVDTCRMCARPMTSGMPFDKWQGSSFTDQNKVKCTSSNHVCAACIWAHSWVQPPGMEPAPAGKKGVCLRLFSHCWDAHGYHYWNKANKAEIRDWLRAPKSPPWFAAVADSGQKHVLPYTPMNPGQRGIIRFEERDVLAGDWGRLDAMTAMLTDGVTKDAVETGEYTPQQWMDSGELIREFEREHGDFRGSGFFDLCIWLAQRDETEWKERFDDRRRQKQARELDRKCAARDAKSLSRKRSKPAKALGPTTRPREDGLALNGGRRGVGDRDKPTPQPRKSEQLSLFGD